ncbi:WhiB family transcriptional regulator [uncultured Microbacterium sp.]|uniref:WhiB family transcriptional regulator n=1 Tax=uncultured Microbacterium sp. TaxID=191216 RepID=UPI003459DAA5
MPRTKTSGGPTVAQAFAALQTALRTTTPLCEGDSRFTSDTSDPAPLKAVCGACPLLPQCRALAIANPAGRVFGVIGGLVCRSEPRTRQSALTR